MRFPWSAPPDPPPEPARPDAHRYPTEGEKARQESEQALEAIHARDPEVSRVSRSLRELRQRNHFAETIAHIYRGEAIQ